MKKVTEETVNAFYNSLPFKKANMEIIMENIKKRLEELRTELRNECISYGELAELQSLTEYIDKDDVELLQAAGVPEDLS